MDWQIGTSTVFGFVGLAIGVLSLWKQVEQPKQLQYYRPPTPVEIPQTKKKIPAME